MSECLKNSIKFINRKLKTPKSLNFQLFGTTHFESTLQQSR